MMETEETSVREGAHCTCGAMFMNGAWWSRIGMGLGHAHAPRGPMVLRG